MWKARILLAAVMSAVVCQTGAMPQAIAQGVSPAGAVEAAVSDPNRPVRDKWALVIGVTQFANPRVPELKYATKDAADFYNYLVKEAHFAPDHVRLLLNDKATQRRIT